MEGEWDQGGEEGAAAIVQAGDEGGWGEGDGVKRASGARTGSRADGLDSHGEGKERAGVSGSLSRPWADARDTELATTWFLL